MECAEHKCPMVECGGEMICPVCWVIEKVGGLRVRDIVPGGKFVGLVFENGFVIEVHQPYMDGWVDVTMLSKNPDQLLDQMAGLVLVGVHYVPRVPGDNSSTLHLNFGAYPTQSPAFIWAVVEEQMARAWIYADYINRYTSSG